MRTVVAALSLTGVLLITVGLAGCSRSEPVQCTADTHCDLVTDGKCVAVAGGHRWCAHPDPNCLGAYRFSSYDVGDNLAGSCIDTTTLVCEAGTFQGCVGNDASFCNATGDGYQPRACALGCSATDGCRSCEVNQTTCTGKTLSVCDAAGKATVSECPLGCADGEPRCKDIVPSNDVGQFLAMAATEPVVVLDDGDVIGKDGYIWRDGKKSGSHVRVEVIPAPANGVPIRVFIVGGLQIGRVTFSTDTADAWAFDDAVAFVAHGDILVRGHVSVAARSWVYSGPGGVRWDDVRGCSGRNGAQNSGFTAFNGGSGAGHATPGGAGGASASVTNNDRRGGAAFENADLVPLRGGCYGGGGWSTNGPNGGAPQGGAGGGAIQLLSRSRVVVERTGAVIANGAGGFTEDAAAGGGGSGGGILLEAPEVVLASGAALVANGGGGGGGQSHGVDGSLSSVPASGTSCATPSQRCGPGGDGGAGTTPPTDGAAASAAATSDNSYAGGGGGAAGFIRINTLSGAYTRSIDAIESPVPSSARLQTR